MRRWCQMSGFLGAQTRLNYTPAGRQADTADGRWCVSVFFVSTAVYTMPGRGACYARVVFGLFGFL